jgi:hypothetical protein
MPYYTRLVEVRNDALKHVQPNDDLITIIDTVINMLGNYKKFMIELDSINPALRCAVDKHHYKDLITFFSTNKLPATDFKLKIQTHCRNKDVTNSSHPLTRKLCDALGIKIKTPVKNLTEYEKLLFELDKLDHLEGMGKFKAEIIKNKEIIIRVLTNSWTMNQKLKWAMMIGPKFKKTTNEFNLCDNLGPNSQLKKLCDEIKKAKLLNPDSDDSDDSDWSDEDFGGGALEKLLGYSTRY